MRGLVSGAVLALVASGALFVSGRVPVSAQPSAVVASGLVSPKPARGTPQLARTGNTSEIVRQLVQCDGTMYAVGSFTKIEWNGAYYRRSNIFSFRATAPFRVTSWDPGANGEVNTIAFPHGSCADAYIGGRFSSVDGTTASDIAEISTTTRKVLGAFEHHASGQVFTLLMTPNGHLLAGGEFTTINGGADEYYASLNPTTGAAGGYLNLHISGHYVYPGVGFNSTSVYNQQLSPNGADVLAEGVFTRVAGQPRQQIFMIGLGSRQATLTGWTSSEFTHHCARRHPFYVKAAAWSPDGSTVYVADTGDEPHDWNGTFPLTGLCAAAAAFPARHTTVRQEWVNYTGCWSLFAVAADASAVYIGGHEKYADNPRGCKNAGPGAVRDAGLGALHPVGGRVLLNARGAAGLYSRSRGRGADDLLLTRAGLWVASDNGLFSHGTFHRSDTCGGVQGHAGICFLPNR
jgi:hypothetical protein